MPSAPSIANSVTVRLVLPARATAVSEMTGVIEAAGGVVTGLDVIPSVFHPEVSHVVAEAVRAAVARRGPV